MDVPCWKAVFPDPGSPGAGSALGFLPPGLSWYLWSRLAGVAMPCHCCSRIWSQPLPGVGSSFRACQAAGAVPAGLCVGGHARCPSPSHRLPWCGSASPFPSCIQTTAGKCLDIFFPLTHGSAARFFPSILSLSLPGWLNELFSLLPALTFLCAGPWAAGRRWRGERAGRGCPCREAGAGCAREAPGSWRTASAG